MSATDFLETAILDHILGTTAYTAPVNTFVKLHIADPTDTGTVGAAGETLRVNVNFNAASSPAGTATNSNEVLWTSVSTTETYSHFTIHDDITAGNPLLTGALTAPVAVTAGDNFSIPIGNLTVTCI